MKAFPRTHRPAPIESIEEPLPAQEESADVDGSNSNYEIGSIIEQARRFMEEYQLVERAGREAATAPRQRGYLGGGWQYEPYATTTGTTWVIPMTTAGTTATVDWKRDGWISGGNAYWGTLTTSRFEPNDR